MPFLNDARKFSGSHTEESKSVCPVESKSITVMYLSYTRKVLNVDENKQFLVSRKVVNGR